MTVVECVSIIRHRNQIISTNNRYTLNLPIPPNNGILPLFWGPTDNATYTFSLGNDEIQKEISALHRAYQSADIMEKYGAEVEIGLKSGKYQIEESADGEMIIYELIPNPFYDRQILDVDLDGVPNRVGNFGNTPYQDIIIPTHLKKPIIPNISEYISESLYTNEEISLTTYYLDLVSAGVNSSGEYLDGRGYGILNKSVQEYISSNNYKSKEKSGIGATLYGSKYYAYGGFFTTFGIITLLSGLRSRYRIPARLFRNWSRSSVVGFLEGPLETGLTGFKTAKNITTQDGFRLIRDIGVYQIGHSLAHGALHNVSVIRIGGRAVFFEIPWVGWALAGLTILYDFLEPIISEQLDENERVRQYIQACRVKKDSVGNETINDPGFAYFTSGKIKKEQIITRDYKNQGTTIGAKKDPNTGNYLFDSKTEKILKVTVKPPSPQPRQQPGGIPGQTVPRLLSPDDMGYNPVNEKLIQSTIESNVLELNLTNKLIAENLSNKTYVPQSSNELPPAPTFPDGISEDREDLDVASDLLPYYDTELAFSNDLQSSGQVPLDNPLRPRVRSVNTGPEIRSPKIDDAPYDPAVMDSTFSSLG